MAKRRRLAWRSGQTTMSSRIADSTGKVAHQPQKGDSYGLLSCICLQLICIRGDSVDARGMLAY